LKKYLRLTTNHLFIPLSLVLLAVIFLFKGNSRVQFAVAFLGVIFYLVTALIHHHFDKSLTVEVTLEYILIAALVLIILGGVLV
jgi:uncharacterized membrane protein